MTVVEKLSLVTVPDAARSAGSDKCHCARVCRIVVQPQKYVLFLPSSRTTGRRVRYTSFSHLTGSLEERDDCLC